MSPTTIDAMLAAGATAEVIAAAWKAEITAQSVLAEDRRAKDRVRQQRKRHAMSRDVTRTERDTSPNERDILTPTREEKPSPKGEVKKADRAVRISVDWEPLPLLGKAAAMVTAWQAGAMERELAKFKNYWLSKGANAARTDWQRTWVNWLISADERTPRHDGRTNPMGRNQPTDGLSSTARAAIAVFGPPGTGHH